MPVLTGICIRCGLALVCAALWICLVAPTQASGQQNLSKTSYTFRHFTPDNGLASIQVRSIVQDERGFVWIASREVISRFDGYTFRVYKFDPDNILQSSYTGGIASLYKDRQNNVWVMSELFSKYDASADSFVHHKPGVDLAKVTRVCFEKNDQIIWFGTSDAGIYRYDTQSGNTVAFRNQTSDLSTNKLVNSIYGISDHDSVLLIASLRGLWLFDKTEKKFTRPNCNMQDTAMLYQSSIWGIFGPANPADDGTWIYESRALIHLDKEFRITRQFDFPSGFNPTMHALDDAGVFWLGTKQAIFQYDPGVDPSALIQVDIPEDQLGTSIFVDREQNLWIGTESYGLYQFSPGKIRFHHFKFDKPGVFSAGSVYQKNGSDHAVLIRGDGAVSELWTAIVNPLQPVDSIELRKLNTQVSPQGLIINASVSSSRLWLCSWRHGITSFDLDPRSGIIETNTMKHFAPNETDPNTARPLTGGVYEDNGQNLWIASRGFGVCRLNRDVPYGTPGAATHFRHDPIDSTSLSHNYTWRFAAEDENSLWVLNWSGVDLFRNGRFEHTFRIAKPRSLLKISKDTLFIGAHNGIYEAVKNREHYTLNPSPILPDYTALNITYDNAGRLWISDPIKTRIVCYDRKTKSAIVLNAKDGVPHGVGFISRTSTGMIAIGSVAGLTVFDPLTLVVSKRTAYPVLTQLKVNNEVPSVGRSKNNHFATKANISVLDELTIDHLNNNFTIEFSSMEMRAPEKNRYRHKLDGFESNWIETDSKERTATYTNLNPGRYVFRVRASNHDGIWSEEETTLNIHILPPPWKTWWAYSLYGFVFAGVLLYWRRYENNRLMHKHRADHLGQLDQLKSRFFANISHEFRTPITLILGPLKDLYERSREETKLVLGPVIRNGERLHRLINQLLDLSKIEAGRMQLHASPVDLVDLLREIAASYESLAEDKKIRYRFLPDVERLLVYVDVEKIEKIIHNLLSNAFKFTGTNGEILLSLRSQHNHALLEVKDTGIGIPHEKLDKIFERFYQVDSSQTRGYEGTGIGLSLAKELVELHKGKLSVQSTEGTGTTFIVALRLGNNHLNNDEITEYRSAGVQQKDLDLVMPQENVIEQNSIESPEKPLLIIVEDNADMRSYLHKSLSDQCRILESENGRSGLTLALETLPDLIISDIMMPEMDGVEMCKQLKTSVKTSHIPVILLTAKADHESKLAGLETGADDYLSKPFDANELKIIVRNRIDERRKMRERFSREITLEPKHIAITSLDERFLKKVLDLIESRLDDEHFTIDEMSREIGFSNMHFFRKLKALTDQTPSQFLRTIRLKRAAELLSKNSDKVTQIAYSVGFSSVSYFSKCFKDQFGTTPGQHAANARKHPPARAGNFEYKP